MQTGKKWYTPEGLGHFVVHGQARLSRIFAAGPVYQTFGNKLNRAENNNGNPRLPSPGFWLEQPNLAALEIAAILGYRAVIIDMEHGVVTAESCNALVAQARAIEITVLIRVAAAERVLVQQALDYGADAVMLPMIRDAAHAADAAAYSKYPPLGTRGVGTGRAFGYGAYEAVESDFYRTANLRTKCHVMIETSGALRDVEAIAALPAVDGLFVGPSDLSLALGRGAFRFTKEDETDFRTVARACRQKGKTLGLPAPNARALALALSEGADYVTISDDLTALRKGLEQALALFRDHKDSA
jgi:4-hydroxy-2-oxoheptanedioate aldolase